MGSSATHKGYRVVDVHPGSPADQAGLVSYLDFVVAANGVNLNQGDQLYKIISKSEDCKLSLKVYNCFHRNYRDVVITPSKQWGGDSLLGASIRYDSWDEVVYLRVVSVVPDSPASKVGLRPEDDYILGTFDSSLSNIDQLASEVLETEVITLFVLDGRTAKVRKISVDVRTENGPNFLGCDVATGIMNIPKPLVQSEPVTTVEEPVKEIPIVKAPPISAPPLTLGGQVFLPPQVKRIEFGAYIIKPPPSLYRLPSTVPLQPWIKQSPYVVPE